jgi:hypothetical protein
MTRKNRAPGDEKPVWDREEVWINLKDVIVYCLKIDPDEVKPEAHFVKDLGVG